VSLFVIPVEIAHVRKQVGPHPSGAGREYYKGGKRGAESPEHKYSVRFRSVRLRKDRRDLFNHLDPSWDFYFLALHTLVKNLTSNQEVSRRNDGSQKRGAAGILLGRPNRASEV